MVSPPRPPGSSPRWPRATGTRADCSPTERSTAGGTILTGRRPACQRSGSPPSLPATHTRALSTPTARSDVGAEHKRRSRAGVAAERTLHRRRRTRRADVRPARRRHRHVLGPRRVRAERNAQRTVHRPVHIGAALVRDTSRRHARLLGRAPDRIAASRRAVRLTLGSTLGTRLSGPDGAHEPAQAAPLE